MTRFMIRVAQPISRRLVLAAFCLAGLAACAGKPPSEPPPASFSLDGDWVLVPELSDEPPRLRQPMDAELPKPGDARARYRDFQRGDLAFLRHDLPVIQAQRMEIEQNRDSMGIAYEPGPYRDISWGERDRGLWRVTTGWEEGRLVIHSKASDVTTTEYMWLDGDLLRVEVFVDGQARDFQLIRVFQPADG